MKFALSKYTGNINLIFLIYFIVCVSATLLKIHLGTINNFVIYRNSFYHFINHKELYGLFPAEQYDEFLYGPLFALLIAPFALLPVNMGVFTWCIFNVFILVTAVFFIEGDGKKKAFMLWFILIELVTSIQNVQINPLMTACMMFTFISFEKGKVQWAALVVVTGTLLKIYPVLAAAVCIFYPDKIKFIVYSVIWLMLFFMIQTCWVPTEELLHHYRIWVQTLTGDRGANMDDISIMHFASRVSGWNVEFTKTVIQICAIIAFYIKFLKVKYYSNELFRKYCFASILIWSVIFSHAAESSTYIVAVAGAALFFSNHEKTRRIYVMMGLVFVFTILAPTDLFPLIIRRNYLIPYAIKSVPCFILWVYIEQKILRFS